MNKSKMLVGMGIWLFFIFIAAVGYKYFVAPKRQESQQQAEKDKRKDVITNTSAQSRYKSHVKLALDSFSGYSVLRSSQFSDYTSQLGVQIDLVDDGADYDKRLAALKSGDVQMAAFTLDALIASSATMGDVPATVVAVIDESNGADGMVANVLYANLDMLNDPGTKFVLVPNSPSQTLTQVVRHYFKMDRLSANPFIFVNNPEEIINSYRASKPSDKLVFVTWQPEILKITANKNYGVLIDSSRFRDYILDVIVVNRDFLLKNEVTVRQVIDSYFRANFDLFNKVELVQLDGKLSPTDAKIVASGISWRNTQENYAHFGITKQVGYSHLEDAIGKITRLLIQSGTIQADPTAGNANVLYYDKVLRFLYESNFHPGNTEENVQGEKGVTNLSEQQWNHLVPVGTMQVEPLVFARGTSQLLDASEQILTELTEKLKTWPQYYLLVRGHTAGDNTPANLELQKQRAQTAVEWLVQHGVNANRVRAEASKSNGSTTVKFVLGQLPY
jgi:outer membrane protein OmpA-like peptidoglycan-associated protein